MKEFSRFFSQTFTVWGTAGQGQTTQGPTWQPLVDIYECENGICIYVELPGTDRDNLEVTVENNVLRIAGYRNKRLPEHVEHVHQMEIPYGPFARYVRLPEKADVGHISAKYENGYLVVEIPRKSGR